MTIRRRYKMYFISSPPPIAFISPPPPPYWGRWWRDALRVGGATSALRLAGPEEWVAWDNDNQTPQPKHTESLRHWLLATSPDRDESPSFRHDTMSQRATVHEHPYVVLSWSLAQRFAAVHTLFVNGHTHKHARMIFAPKRHTSALRAMRNTGKITKKLQHVLLLDTRSP